MLKNLHEKAVDKFGEFLQIQKTLEELIELKVELSKYLNGFGDVELITEELADVQNMICQIQIIFGITDCVKEDAMIEKMKRCLGE